MEKIDADSDSSREYFVRLEQRLKLGHSIARQLAQLTNFALSADDHFKRLITPLKRYHHAKEINDQLSAAREKPLVYALLYEILDTAYSVLNLLDLSKLDLECPSYSQGLIGDSAADAVHLFDILNELSRRVLEIEKELDLRLDFSVAYPESKGLTFEHRSHWQDFIPGNPELSFFAYFTKVQHTLIESMHQTPYFWNGQCLNHYLKRQHYNALVEAVDKVRKADFSPRWSTRKFSA